MGILIHWLVLTVSLVIVAYLLPGIRVASFGTALMAGAVLGLINALIKPILVILTMPITLLTLGLFALVLNALILWAVAGLVNGFDVDGFGWAFVAALLLSVVTAILGWLTPG